ncbi:outer membrane receptor for ferric coprogen and ferric-rhodotorulic acid [Comamonas sp. BIGb0152]|uniref:TonB-dependent siderophore receptor n=1 Tax=Comamonas sp. BIGb0152 TaxID=2940601 RepID=UPI002168D308|nr:TonB-dependent receptor [Comamonas sp. BIGb0152]MCS4294977.1 outer membrane receptor for ferric coprogen and ferric-rhodotorulic acid [Comamonas sp. BIGb0152]
MYRPRFSAPVQPRGIAVSAHLLCLGLAACATFGALPQTAQAQQPASPQAVRSYSIPAGPLAAALNRLGQDSGTLISFAPDTVAGLQSPGVQGATDVGQALAALLAGSPLQAQRDASGSYVVRRAAPAAPQTAAQPASAAAAGAPSITLPELRVTAQAERSATTEGSGNYTIRSSAAATGLQLSPRETPQSVSVLTRQQIEDQGITSIGEAARHITGISAISSDSDRTDLDARGFYIDNYQYDGVPTFVANDFFGASMLDPILYDRIEVVRGATGLMTGAGNPGASVNLVRKRASSKTFTGSASVSLGSWNERRATLDLSTPLTDDGRIRARVAAMADERDSHLDRYHTRNRALLATVEADLTPDTTAWIGLEHQAKRPTGVTWGGLPMVYQDGSATHWPRSFSIGADWTSWNTTSNTTYAGLEHRFDNGWSIKASASRLDADYSSKLLYLLNQPEQGTGLGLGPYPNYSRQTFTQNSGSLQATGPFDLLGRKHEAVVGLTASQSNYAYGNHAYTATPIGNIFEWDGSYPEPVWGAFRPLGDDRTRQSAVYGALRLSLADDLKLIIGGRESRWESQSLTATRKHDVFTPYAGLLYDINATYTVYASYTDIFQPQNYQDTQGRYLDPVTGKSYEAGIKAAFLDGKVNASLAVFHIAQDNVAVQDGDNMIGGTGNPAYRGEKGVTSKGFEAEVSGELARGWQLIAGFARADARNADQTRLQSQRPNNMAHLYTTYRLPGNWTALKVGGGLTWKSATYATTTTSTGVDARRDQGSITLASMMASYDISRQLSVQLNINNLFDKNYYDFAGSQIYYGAPRKFTLTAKYDF